MHTYTKVRELQLRRGGRPEHEEAADLQRPPKTLLFLV